VFVFTLNSLEQRF